ncbi:MAG: hypothetical protein Kow0069_33310 [Promethearchaeota archaeon]
MLLARRWRGWNAKRVLGVVALLLAGASSLLPGSFAPSSRGGAANTTPRAATGGTPPTIWLNYTVKWDVENDLGKSTGSLDLSLLVRGDDGLLGNGTIEYFVGENVSDPAVTAVLENALIPEVAAHVEEHEAGETLTTQFSYRRESLDSNFTTNASYTFFWLNTSVSPVAPGRNVRFMDVEAPLLLNVDKFAQPTLTAWTWSTSRRELERDVDVLRSYWLFSHLNFEGGPKTTIDLYYDQVHAVLLRATFDHEAGDSSPVRYHLDVLLAATNLELRFEPVNPYHRAAIVRWTAVGVVAGVAVAVSAFALAWRSRRSKDRATA